MPRFITKKVKSLEQYMSMTADLKDRWSTKKYYPDPWFRGVVDKSYKLQPGFCRSPKAMKGIDEGDLRDEFERRSPPLIDGQHPRNRWEWYFLMQHYGLPTRLLDWSESSLVGLYFAVVDWKGTRRSGTKDAAVWMLDPWYMNRFSKRKDEVFRFDEKPVQRYLPEQHWRDDKIPSKPVALMPVFNSRRITAQRGMFTLHGTNGKPLEDILPSVQKPHLAKIVIPQAYVEEIGDALRTAGMSDVVVFPELAHLCLDICHAWGI